MNMASFSDTGMLEGGIQVKDSCDVYITNKDSSITIFMWQMDKNGWIAFNPPLGQCELSLVTWVNTNEDHSLNIAYRKAGVTPGNTYKKATCNFHSQAAGENCIIQPGALTG